MDRILAWTYSLSFPIAVAALLILRFLYGYNWPLPSQLGLLLVGTGFILLLRDVVLPYFVGSVRSTRQALYSEIWLILLGAWMYWKILNDLGLIAVVAIASALWPLSHLELQRHFGILANKHNTTLTSRDNSSI